MSNKIKRLLKELSLEILGFILMTLSIAFLWKYNGILLLIYISILYYLDSFLDKSEMIMGILGILFFAWGEIFIIHFGAWVYYVNPDFFGIPIWLPYSWGLLVILIIKLYKTINKFFEV